MSPSMWLLNNVSTAGIVILVVGGLMAFAGFGLITVRKRWPDLEVGEHNDVAGVLLGLVGAIYGIMLAFVVVSVYSTFMEAERTVRAEASEIAEVYADTRGLPIAAAIEAGVDAYVHDVVEDEWPLLAIGESSAKVDQDLEGLFATLQAFEPTTQAQTSFYEATIDDLNAVIEARRDKIFAAGQEVPVILQLLLYGGAILLVSFTWLFGMRRFRTQLLMVMGVAGLVGFSLVVVLAIDHPFAGDVVVSSEPFRQGILARFW
jgi:hypothetical protein